MQAPQDNRRELFDALTLFASAYPAQEAEALRIRGFVASTADCFERRHAAGHITGSAFLLNPAGDKVLLCLHKKLQKWLQLGGHSDGDPHTLQVALREASEESGIEGILPMSPKIFDVDVHLIPARGCEPAHYHYDIRYLLQAPHEDFTCSEESEQLAWLKLCEIGSAFEASLQRMSQRALLARSL